MRNLFFYLLMVSGFIFYSCNQGGGGGEEGSTEGTTTEETMTETPDDQMSTDMIQNESTDAEEMEEPVGGNAKMEFEAYDWDFGKITQGEKVEHTFKFTNTGTEPLVISDAKGSCGCTVPSYPKEPIPPGESSEIRVAFNSKGKKGVQRKSVNITANTTPNRTTLNITSEVLVPGEEEAPAE